MKQQLEKRSTMENQMSPYDRQLTPMSSRYAFQATQSGIDEYARAYGRTHYATDSRRKAQMQAGEAIARFTLRARRNMVKQKR